MTGNGPPPNTKPVELVTLLRQKPRPSKVVDAPVSGVEGTPYEQVRIMVPPSNVTGEAQLAAHRRMKVMMPNLEEWKTETGASILGDLCAKERLARMLYGVEDHGDGTYARWFASSEDVERAMSPDEVAIMFSLCMQVERELGPRLQVLQDSDVDAWIEALKVGFDPLAYLQSPDLEVLVRGLHRRVLSLQARLSGYQHQDSPPSSSLDTMESQSTNSATSTTFFGEPHDQPLDGSTEFMTPDELEALARQMASRSKVTE